MSSVSQSCIASGCWFPVGAFNVTTIHWLSSEMFKVYRVEMFDRTFASVLSNDYWSVHPGFCRRRCALALELGRGTMATTIDIFAAPPRSQLLSRWSFFPASGGNSNCPLDTKCDGPRMSCEFHLV